MSIEWTDELRDEAVKKYLEQEPTPENSAEIVNEIAEEMGVAPNGLRMILIRKEVYVKKTPATSASAASSSGGSKRVSKADAQATLTAAITAKGLEADDDIISKLTGKAAVYFAEILSA